MGALQFIVAITWIGSDLKQYYVNGLNLLVIEMNEWIVLD